MCKHQEAVVDDGSGFLGLKTTLKMSSLNLDRNIGFSLDLKVMAIHRSEVEISYIVLYIFPKGKQ